LRTDANARSRSADTPAYHGAGDQGRDLDVRGDAAYNMLKLSRALSVREQDCVHPLLRLSVIR